MSLSVPNAANYATPVFSRAANWARDPVEGIRFIPAEIDWSLSAYATLKCVMIDVQGQGAQKQMTQICAISVDNSACGADVSFIFSDTSQTYDIPAWSAGVITPVFTNGTQVFIYAPDAQAGDVTRFALHNTIPPVLAIPDTAEAQNVVGNNVALTGAGSTQLIAAGINGIISNIQLNAGGPITTAGAGSIYLADGAANNVAAAVYGGAINGPLGPTLLSLEGVQLRFTNGLKLNQFGPYVPSAAAFLAYNVNYRRIR